MRRLFVDVLLHYRQEQKYQLHDFVLMPDHFHLLITLTVTGKSHATRERWILLSREEGARFHA
jgi:REP element-mobilizing transposase RayT